MAEYAALLARYKCIRSIALELNKVLPFDEFIMTCGAGGALNVALKALLDPGDEVIVIAPFFPEYRFYIDNHGGKMVIAESGANFDLDIEQIDRVVGQRT